MNTQARWNTYGAPAPADAPLRPARSASATADDVLCLLLAVYLTSLLIEGVLRYLLVTIGAPNLLYARDVIPVGSVLFLFLRTLLRDQRIDLAIAIPAALLACHAMWAAVLGVAVFQIAFGLKIFIFIVYGIAMWPLLRRRFDAGLTWASLMFAVAAAGVFANYFLERMPWEGLDYETAFGASSTTRLWWIPGGQSRLPGFARTSFDAAMIVGITGLLAMVKYHQALARVFIFAAALVAIVLTTSKGITLAFPLAALWLAVHDRRPGMDGSRYVGALWALSLALPLMVVFWDIGAAMKASNFPLFLVSVWERFSSMWPLAFQLLPDGPLSLLGAGLGAIGTPQSVGDVHRLNSGDSLTVYMAVTFGVAGLLYCALPALSVRKVAAAQPANVHRAYVSILVVAYAYGLSINMIEQSFFSFFFGLCFGAAARAWQAGEES